MEEVTLGEKARLNWEVGLAENTARPGNKLNPVTRVGFTKDAVNVSFNRIHTNVQGIGNLLILCPFGNEQQDILFPFG